MASDWLLHHVHVNASGDQEQTLLQDVNLRVKAGEITLLLGQNGAGKSTLLESLAGLRELDSGSIRLGEQSLWTEKGKKRLNSAVIRRIGIAMQQSEAQWFASTVREELAFSLRPYRLQGEETEMRMQAALDKVGLDLSFLERDPWTLSGGQQRRLAIACLLACEPDWLLLDEPTAGLAADGIQRLSQLLIAHRTAGRGAIVVTHDLEALLPLADAVIVVREGKAFEAAPAEAALALGAAAPQSLLANVLLGDMGLLQGGTQTDEGIEKREALWQPPEELARRIASKLLSAHSVEADKSLSSKGTSAEGDLSLSSKGPSIEADMSLSSKGPFVEGAMPLPSKEASTEAATPLSNKEPLAAQGLNSSVMTMHDHAIISMPDHATIPMSEHAIMRGNSHTTGFMTTEEANTACMDTANHSNKLGELYARSASNETNGANGGSKRKQLDERFDPRALVLAYLILATGLLSLASLSQLAIGALVVAASIVPFRKLLIPLLPIIRGFLYFSLAFIVIAAVQLQPFELQWSKAEPLAIRMLQLWMIMMIGMPLLALMSPIRLQRGLEQTFGWMVKLRIPIHSFSLLVMLIFRFIPLLMKEWGRFAKIVKARGKTTARGNAIPVRLLRYLFIPYIRAILRMAESMADALEARGFGQNPARSTQGFRLSFTSGDAILLLAAISGCLVLLAVRLLL